MKDYIKLFLTPEAANEYEIQDIPFSCRIRSTELNLVCNEENKILINEDGTVKVVTASVPHDWYVDDYNVVHNFNDILPVNPDLDLEHPKHTDITLNVIASSDTTSRNQVLSTIYRSLPNDIPSANLGMILFYALWETGFMNGIIPDFRFGWENDTTDPETMYGPLNYEQMKMFVYRLPIDLMAVIPFDFGLCFTPSDWKLLMVDVCQCFIDNVDELYDHLEQSKLLAIDNGIYSEWQSDLERNEFLKKYGLYGLLDYHEINLIQFNVDDLCDYLNSYAEYCNGTLMETNEWIAECNLIAFPAVRTKCTTAEGLVELFQTAIDNINDIFNQLIIDNELFTKFLNVRNNVLINYGQTIGGLSSEYEAKQFNNLCKISAKIAYELSIPIPSGLDDDTQVMIFENSETDEGPFCYYYEEPFVQGSASGTNGVSGVINSPQLVWDNLLLNFYNYKSISNNE